jgi:predicted DNA-binding transcriptional regulator YafY
VIAVTPYIGLAPEEFKGHIAEDINGVTIMTTKEHRVQALLDLLTRRSDTAERLGNVLGVSYRSVYRYAEELRRKGVRIDTGRGTGGGLMLRPQRRAQS